MPLNLLNTETAPELDSYLTTLGKELKTLPQEERDAAQIELRQHLESLVAAQVELGTPPARAVDAALATFGDARTLGKTLCQTWDERLMPLDLHADLSRFHLLTIFPAQLAASHVVTLFARSNNNSPTWWGIALLWGIAAVCGWSLGKKHPAHGSTAILVYNFAYLAVLPAIPIICFAVPTPVLTPDFSRTAGQIVLTVLAVFSLSTIIAAVFAHLCVMVRAKKWVAYPWHELRLLPKRAYLMVTRRKVENGDFYRQMLRW